MQLEEAFEITYHSSNQNRRISWTLSWVLSRKCKVNVILKDTTGIIVGSDVSDKELYVLALDLKRER